MLEATGYRLKVEQKFIQVNLSDAADAHPDTTKNQHATNTNHTTGAGSGFSLAS